MKRTSPLVTFTRRQTRQFLVGLAIVVCAELLGGGGLASPARLAAQQLAAQQPIAKAAWGVDSGVVRLPPGLVAKSLPRDRFNQLLFLGTPKLTHGDVDAVTDLVRDNSSLFKLTIMATVQPENGKHRLREVGLGLAYQIGDRPTIVTSAKAESLGADLGMVASRVLAKNEAMLDPPMVILKTTNLVIFDVIALVSIGGKHVDRRMRHLVWTHPDTGRTATAVWLLNEETTPARSEHWSVETAMPIHLIPADTVEDRAIHVDGNEISILMIPKDRAFALQRMPGPVQIPWSSELKTHLGYRAFDEESMSRMLQVLNEAIADATGSETQNR
ncbi:pyruvate kinase [Rhodopirellula halodulae]|uniref:pyruvate kinase n=1 Tax=Rhodopirellula halodulae TaxID=2894198 RepID=UPI001E56BA9F|nr:pyruvate kinase [Rhodopirellula sp. JC737]MCC9654725.1 pyruvate kinase [Rhodopirellula sp. JC737]